MFDYDHRDETVGVVVDAPNLYRSAKSRGGSPNYLEMVRRIVPQGLIMAIACVALRKEDSEANGFLGFLSHHGFSVFVHHTKEKSGTVRASNDADVGFALAYLAFEAGCRKVVLVSGDGDFIGIVRFLVQQDVHVTVAAFPEALSRDLTEVASEVITLDDSHVTTPKSSQDSENQTQVLPFRRPTQ